MAINTTNNDSQAQLEALQATIVESSALVAVEIGKDLDKLLAVTEGGICNADQNADLMITQLNDIGNSIYDLVREMKKVQSTNLETGIALLDLIKLIKGSMEEDI